MKRRVVITGMGAVTPIGNTVDEMWAGAKAGKNGIDYIKNLDVSEHKLKIAAEIKNLDIEAHIGKKEMRKMARYCQLAIIAAREAYNQAGLRDTEIDRSRFGTIVSSGIGGLGTMEMEHLKALDKGYDRVSPFLITMMIANMGAGLIAIEFGAEGICSCPVTACAGGSYAVGDAFHYIRDGYADIMMTGGAEAAITHLGVGGFTTMKAVNFTDDLNRASIPFDAERSGFVMGEGAGILILEEYEHAKARGAKILGEVVGYGATCDAYHITLPKPGGAGAAMAMEMALHDAGITPEQVDYINAHGTSTPANDKTETAAIKTAFGDAAYKVSVSSTKSMMGHLLGGSGAVEAVICAKALQDDFVPPTINYKIPDPECDLDITPNVGKEKVLNYAMSNSLGFGGHNASLLFKKYKED